MAASEVKRLRSTLKRLVAFAGGLLLLGVLFTAIEYRFNSTSGALTINIEEVNGKRFVTKEDIGKLIKETFYGETPKTIEDLLADETLKRINLKALEKTIDNYPWVKESDVYVDAQNNITINIEQRKPLMRCFDVNDYSFYIDENGIRMPVSEHETARVIVASGNLKDVEGSKADSVYNVVDSLYKLVQYIQKDTFLMAQIEQIYVERDGDFTLIPKVGNTELLFGSLNMMEDKFRRLKIFYKEAMPYEGWRKFKRLNLKYKKQVVGVRN
ncbi:MAG: cell division protein FtsQ [Cognaticolwellia sp.]|jgi:cell division protein FtsQ